MMHATQRMCTCMLLSTDVTTTTLPKITSTLLAEEGQGSYKTTTSDSNSSLFATSVIAAQSSTCQEGKYHIKLHQYD